MGAPVLLVDDDVSIRAVMASALRDAGYEVSEADNGQDALALAKTIDSVVIIADLVMPQMGGIELITKLREDGNNTPIIILTSDRDIDSMNEAMKLHVNDYFNKSDSNLDLLIASVNKHARPDPAQPTS